MCLGGARAGGAGRCGKYGGIVDVQQVTAVAKLGRALARRRGGGGHVERAAHRYAWWGWIDFRSHFDGEFNILHILLHFLLHFLLQMLLFYFVCSLLGSVLVGSVLVRSVLLVCSVLVCSVLVGLVLGLVLGPVRCY